MPAVGVDNVDSGVDDEDEDNGEGDGDGDDDDDDEVDEQEIKGEIDVLDVSSCSGDLIDSFVSFGSLEIELDVCKLPNDWVVAIVDVEDEDLVECFELKAMDFFDAEDSISRS